MAGLGTITLDSLKNTSYDSFSFDESICGILFDYGLRTAVFDDYPVAESFFKDNQVQLINNLEEAEKMGLLENGFMNGIPHYHIKQYYDFVGEDHKLYISFASCISYLNGNVIPDFSQIQYMQQEAKGEIYQVGVWTEQCIWCDNDGEYGFTQLLGELQTQGETLCGIRNTPSNSASALSVILNCCTSCLYGDNSSRKKVSFKTLPNAISLDFHKVMVVLGQNGTDEVHQMQLQNINYTPVGMIGFALACCTMVPAEESIGSLLYCNLNKDDNFQSPELGFGDLTDNIKDNDYNSIENVNQIRRNIISMAGYVLPTTYKAKEAAVYLSNDQCLSEGDYKSLANNRVIHKLRRIIKSVMLPYVEGNVEMDPNTGKIAVYDAALITNALNERADAVLVNSKGQAQVSGRIIEVDLDSNILENDSINIDVRLVPASSSDIINFRETYEIEGS